MFSLTLLMGLPAGAACAQDTKPKERSASAAEAYTFAFADADIAQVVQEILGQALGVNYTIDASVSGKMSFRIEQRLTRPQLLAAFEQALAANDIALVRNGDLVNVVARSKAKSPSGLGDDGTSAHGAGYGVAAIPLSFIAPSEASKALTAVTASKTVLYTDDKLGLIVLGGSGSELDSALATLKVLDRSAFEGARLRWFDLTQAAAQSVSSDLEKVLKAANAETIAVVPLKRLNALIVVARTSKALDDASSWVSKLDTPSRDLSTELYVYHPRSASATSLAKTLASVLSNQQDHQSGGGSSGQGGGQGTNPSNTPSNAVGQPSSTSNGSGGTKDSNQDTSFSSQILDDGVRISADKDTNTLLVLAPPARWIALQRTLVEIDRPPRQVMIEASILEVTLTKAFQFGVDWSVLGDKGRMSVQSINSASGTVGASVPGFSVNILSSGVAAAINTLSTVTDVQVVSAPKIIVLDNYPAKLEVGDQVPIVNQTASTVTTSSPALITTVDYRDTGVILNVTPRISGDDKVVLDVGQEVSSVASTTSSSLNSPTIQQRKLQSTLVISDGGVVALGGLISTNKTKTSSGLPGVGDIPWLGALFKTQSTNDTRDELIVLLTVHIMRDPSSSNRVLHDLLADMHEIEARGLVPK